MSRPNFPPSNIPSNIINSLRNQVNKPITVELREVWIRLKGTLVCYDQYSNLHIADVSEFNRTPEGKYIESPEKYKNAIIRGDSITNILL